MTQNTANAHGGEATGILYAGAAYAFWGITPLYWRFLGEVPPFELTTHRVLWCALFVAIVPWLPLPGRPPTPGSG